MRSQQAQRRAHSCGCATYVTVPRCASWLTIATNQLHASRPSCVAAAPAAVWLCSARPRPPSRSRRPRELVVLDRDPSPIRASRQVTSLAPARPLPAPHPTAGTGRPSSWQRVRTSRSHAARRSCKYSRSCACRAAGACPHLHRRLSCTGGARARAGCAPSRSQPCSVAITAGHVVHRRARPARHAATAASPLADSASVTTARGCLRCGWRERPSRATRRALGSSRSARSAQTRRWRRRRLRRHC